MEEIRQWIEDLSSGDDDRAEAAAAQFNALDEAQQSAALEALRPLLASSDPDLRWWVTRALGNFRIAPAGELLTAALADDEPAVRQCAALGLRQHPDPQSVPALLRLLEDSDLLCASLAADALAHTGAPALPGLIEALKAGPQQARREAIRALASMRNQQSIPALFEALEDESALIEYWANEGLERMGVGMAFFKPG